MHLIESVYHLSTVHSDVPDMIEPDYLPPRTIKEAVERLITEMSLKDRTSIANMAEVELDALNMRLGQYIRNNFGCEPATIP